MRFLIVLFVICLTICVFEVKAQNHLKNTSFSCELKTNDYYMELLLNAAITADNAVCVKKILDSGVNPNEPKGKAAPIGIAVLGKKTEILKLLIDAGLDVESDDTKTALLNAISIGNYDSVKVLLKAGVSANNKGVEGITPLLLSAIQNDVNIVKLLLGYKANVNLSLNSGETSLMLANSSQIVELLVEYNADLDAKDIEGRTAIFYAIKRYNIDKLDLLLKNGANANIKSKNGLTPLMLARQINDFKQRNNIIELLKKYGAK